MVNDVSFGSLNELAVHEDSRVFPAGQAYGAFGVEHVFAPCPAETPFVSAQALIILRIDYGEAALGQWDSAEGVAVAQTPPEQHQQNGNPFEPGRDYYDKLSDFPLRWMKSETISKFEFQMFKTQALELSFSAPAKRRPPILGRTCAFDAKIYKNVDAIFIVSLCLVWNKKIFKLLYFYFQLPSLLVEIHPTQNLKLKTQNYHRHRYWPHYCGGILT